MKGYICHFVKWQIHPLISKGMIYSQTDFPQVNVYRAHRLRVFFTSQILTKNYEMCSYKIQNLGGMYVGDYLPLFYHNKLFRPKENACEQITINCIKKL